MRGESEQQARCQVALQRDPNRRVPTSVDAGDGADALLADEFVPALRIYATQTLGFADPASVRPDCCRFRA